MCWSFFSMLIHTLAVVVPTILQSDAADDIIALCSLWNFLVLLVPNISSWISITATVQSHRATLIYLGGGTRRQSGGLWSICKSKREQFDPCHIGHTKHLQVILTNLHSASLCESKAHFLLYLIENLTVAGHKHKGVASKRVTMERNTEPNI